MAVVNIHSLFIGLQLAACAVTEKQPNFIFIFADDYGWNDIGYHGSEIKTPVMDQLAATGVKLENYYVNHVCTPSRSDMLTGRYTIHTGLQHSHAHHRKPMGVPLNVPTVADKLRELGYSTNIVGKWHLGFYRKGFMPTYRGFDTFFGYLTGGEDYYNRRGCEAYCGLDFRINETTSQPRGYSTHLFTSRVQSIIADHGKGRSHQPLFIYLAYQAVHSPLQVPKEYSDKYDFSNAKRNTYAGMTTCMDEGIGNITRSFQEHGLWNNTILIFSTDNGGDLKNGADNSPLRGGKGTWWEGGTRAIGFVHSPLLPKTGLISNELIHVTDWFPTMLQLAGGDTAGLQLDGFNVWDTISKEEASPRKEILHSIDPINHPHGLKTFNHPFDHRMRGVIRVGKWKLLTGDPGPSKASETNKNMWLFDIVADPQEERDLSDSKPDIVKMLLDRLDYYNSTTVPCQWPADDEASNPQKHGGFWGPWMPDLEADKHYYHGVKDKNNEKRDKENSKVQESSAMQHNDFDSAAKHVIQNYSPRPSSNWTITIVIIVPTFFVTIILIRRTKTFLANR